MLAAERCDPQIVGGDGFTLLFQFQTDRRIGVGRLLIDVQHKHHSNPLTQPTFVGGLVPGLRDSQPILSQYDHRDREAIRAGDTLQSRIFPVGNGG